MIRYKKKKRDQSFWLTILLLLLLILFSHRNPSTSALPSRLLNTLISPVNAVFYTISQSAQELYDRAFGDRATQAKVNELKKENQILSEKVRRLGMVISESETLKQSARLRALNPNQMIEAHVSGLDPSSHFIRFTINRGSKDGVQQGDIVIAGIKDEKTYSSAGLVGKVVEVGLTYAKVSTIMDQANNVSVLFADTGGYGIVNSRDKERFFGYLLDPSTPVKTGEDVLTSGIGGVYPRGLYVGKTTKVETAKDGLTKNVAIHSVIDFNRLYHLLVFHPHEPLRFQEEQDHPSPVRDASTAQRKGDNRHE